jgi:hypothetical protein
VCVYVCVFACVEKSVNKQILGFTAYYTRIPFGEQVYSPLLWFGFKMSPKISCPQCSSVQRCGLWEVIRWRDSDFISDLVH